MAGDPYSADIQVEPSDDVSRRNPDFCSFSPLECSLDFLSLIGTFSDENIPKYVQVDLPKRLIILVPELFAVHRLNQFIHRDQIVSNVSNSTITKAFYTIEDN